MVRGLIWLRLFGVVEFRVVKIVRLDPDVGLRLSDRECAPAPASHTISYEEDAVPGPRIRVSL